MVAGGVSCFITTTHPRKLERWSKGNAWLGGPSGKRF